MPAISHSRGSILQSPWYWVYLFSAASLAALFLIGGKFSQRQAMLENQFIGHEAAQRGGEPLPGRELSTPEQTMITLQPLFLLLAAVFVAAWIVLWWQHFRRRRASDPGRPHGEGGA